MTEFIPQHQTNVKSNFKRDGMTIIHPKDAHVLIEARTEALKTLVCGNIIIL